MISRRWTISIISAALALTLSLSCSGGRKLSPIPNDSDDPLHTADSLFEAGDYNKAKEAYSYARDTLSDTKLISDAQYKLAVLYLYYDNDNVNLDSALLELRYFATLFPDAPRAGEAISWIKILNLLKKTRKDLKSQTRTIKYLKQKNEQLAADNKVKIDSLTKTLNTLQLERDSLFDENVELKQILIELERKCQKSGR
ncbi:MAG: hypothetical protein ACOC36_06965 [Fibrobacterota bacterium]